MNVRAQLLLVYIILAVANTFALIIDITTNSGLPPILLSAAAVAATVWLVWDTYRDLKREQVAAKKVVDYVYSNLRNK